MRDLFLMRALQRIICVAVSLFIGSFVLILSYLSQKYLMILQLDMQINLFWACLIEVEFSPSHS